MALKKQQQLACVVLLMCMVLGAAPIAEAAVTSCGQVITTLSPCINYLRNGGPLPPACCSGIRGLYGAATRTSDRQTVCKCLVTASTTIPGVNIPRAAGAPGKCGINIPYTISPTVDCSKVK